MLSKTNTHISLVLLTVLAMIMTPNLASAVAGDQAAESSNIMNSSPLYADSGASYHACNVMNVTTAPQRVKIDIISASGVVLATSGPTVITLAAGAFREIVAINYSGFARCRVSGAVPSNIRANLSVFRDTGPYFETLALSELR